MCFKHKSHHCTICKTQNITIMMCACPRSMFRLYDTPRSNRHSESLRALAATCICPCRKSLPRQANCAHCPADPSSRRIYRHPRGSGGGRHEWCKSGNSSSKCHCLTMPVSEIWTSWCTSKHSPESPLYVYLRILSAPLVIFKSSLGTISTRRLVT